MPESCCKLLRLRRVMRELRLQSPEAGNWAVPGRRDDSVKVDPYAPRPCVIPSWRSTLCLSDAPRSSAAWPTHSEQSARGFVQPADDARCPRIRGEGPRDDAGGDVWVSAVCRAPVCAEAGRTFHRHDAVAARSD